MKKNFYHPLHWLLIVLLGIFSLSFGSDKINYLDMMDEAEGYFSFEEYTEALPLYIRIQEKYPDNHYLDYKIGRCYLNLPYDRQKSLNYLQKAREKTPLVVKTGNFRHDQVPFDVIFYLGDAYRVNNHLEKAIATYKEFILVADNKVFDLDLAEDQILSCARAIIMEKNPVVTNESNCGDLINTRFSEINPVVSDDESVMIYAANLQFYQAVFYSHNYNGKWSAPENIIPDLQVDGDCLPVCISADGKEVYFYRFDNALGDLYVSTIDNNGRWTKVRKLNGNINTKYLESRACLSVDGKTLYFSSNRPGGYGGLDIYKSQRTKGDNWGPAVNCGPVINSKYNDDSPYLTSDDKRLYFTSFGHETMGGYDIFYTEKDSSGVWTKPVNPGFPVNTTDDELFFCPVKGGKAGYTYKFDEKGQGKYDICRLDIPEHKKYVTGPQMTTIIDSVLKKETGSTRKIKAVTRQVNDSVLPASNQKATAGFSRMVSHTAESFKTQIVQNQSTETKHDLNAHPDNLPTDTVTKHDKNTQNKTDASPGFKYNRRLILTSGGILTLTAGAIFLIFLIIYLFRRKINKTTTLN